MEQEETLANLQVELFLELEGALRVAFKFTLAHVGGAVFALLFGEAILFVFGELGIWYGQAAMVADELELLEEHRHGSPLAAGELGFPAQRALVGTSLRLHKATLAHVTLAALNFEGLLESE